jgi:Poly(A) polymerase catalytic subunit
MDPEFIKKAQNIVDYETAHDPSMRQILRIVKDFIARKRVMCYGGTAINNLLPKEDRFYDPNYFYSKGFRNIEVKPGAHLMTFKVFVDFTGVADITHLETPIFKVLWDEDLVKQGIHYVSPNFLRMSMYLELSRPRGDISRWEKVYKRLTLLNKHYPVGCQQREEKGYSVLSSEQRTGIEKILQTKSVVLLGIHAAELHSRSRSNVWQVPIDILADDMSSTIDQFVSLVEGVELRERPAYGELLPAHVDILDKNGNLLVRVFKTFACHSYHLLQNGMRVASIPTLLQFFFAFVYADAHFIEGGYDQDRVICICQRLMDLAASTKRRFELLTPLDCLGHQETLTEMKQHKSELYGKIPKKSDDFLRLFFAYKPGTLNKTQKQRVKAVLRKTAKIIPDDDVDLVTDQTQ